MGKPQAEINFQPYLQSILEDKGYQEWQDVYTPTTVEDRQRISVQNGAPVTKRRFSSHLKRRVERVKPNKAENREKSDSSSATQERVEQWDVLAGLRKYASEHVLLIGKPGSGKSTSLENLLWEEAEKALQDPSLHVPVLVRLRRCTGTIEALIRDFLLSRQLVLTLAEVEQLLCQGRFLLLLDGLNELPETFRTEMANFRDRYRTTPMIVSTRDMAIGGTLRIEKTLKMLPLTEPQMQEFVQGYLGEDGEYLFQQLKGDRLRKFAETPLLLWMLCGVFADECDHAEEEQRTPKLPENLGLAFRDFTQLYDQGTEEHQAIQADAPVNSRKQWPKLLRQLAFALMHDQKPVEFRLSMSIDEAETRLTDYLQQEGRDNPRGHAERWLQDLLDYHLIQPVMQPNSEQHLEFRHQLIQEYYAAEYLLKLLPTLTDEELKGDYLNYLKWTEPVALMLALVDEEEQALRVVRLAMNEVDFTLGARLAGEVRQEFQEQTVGLIKELVVPDWLRVQLFGETRSECAIPFLSKFLESSDVAVRQEVVQALGEIDSAQGVDTLIGLLNDPSLRVRKKVAEVLAEINSSQSVDALIWVWEHGESKLSSHVAEILAKAISKRSPIVLELVMKFVVSCANQNVYDDIPESSSNSSSDNQSLRDDSEKIYEVHRYSDHQPKKLKITIDSSMENLDESGVNTRSSAAITLGKTKSEQAVLPLIEALKDPEQHVRASAAKALGKLESKQAISFLIKALQDPSANVRSSAAKALGKLESKQAIPLLIKALQDPEKIVQISAVSTLGKLESKQAIPLLIKALQDPEKNVRASAASALGKLESKQAIPLLIKALQDPGKNVRASAASALGKLESKQAIPLLIKALKDPEQHVRESAASALGKLESKQAIPLLIEALQDPEKIVQISAAKALGNLDSDQTIIALRESLKNAEKIDRNLRRHVLDSLIKIGCHQTLLEILNDLLSPQEYKSSRAQGSLLSIQSKKSVSTLTKIILDLDDPQHRTVINIFLQDRTEASIIELKSFIDRIDVLASNKRNQEKNKKILNKKIPLILKLLKHPAPNKREQAAEALGRNTEFRDAVGHLMCLTSDEVYFVRGSAVKALGEVGSKQAIYTLSKTLKDKVSSVRWQSAEALGKIGSDRAIESLIRALDDSDSTVRETVVEALEKIKSDKLAPHLPNLLTKLHGKSGQEVAWAISIIQNHCQFYNYDVWQTAISTQDEKKKNKTHQGKYTFRDTEKVQIIERVEHYHENSLRSPHKRSP